MKNLKNKGMMKNNNNKCIVSDMMWIKGIEEIKP